MVEYMTILEALDSIPSTAEEEEGDSIKKREFKICGRGARGIMPAQGTCLACDQSWFTYMALLVLSTTRDHS